MTSMAMFMPLRENKKLESMGRSRTFFKRRCHQSRHSLENKSENAHIKKPAMFFLESIVKNPLFVALRVLWKMVEKR